MASLRQSEHTKRVRRLRIHCVDGTGMPDVQNLDGGPETAGEEDRLLDRGLRAGRRLDRHQNSSDRPHDSSSQSRVKLIKKHTNVYYQSFPPFIWLFTIAASLIGNNQAPSRFPMAPLCRHRARAIVSSARHRRGGTLKK